jgi:hypothetical protein
MSDREIHAGTRPQVAVATTQGFPPRIAKRTRGYTHGQITRLMSPSDFGRLLKPFVFLDLFDSQGMPFPSNMGAPSAFRHRNRRLPNGGQRQL